MRSVISNIAALALLIGGNSQVSAFSPSKLNKRTSSFTTRTNLANEQGRGHFFSRINSSKKSSAVVLFAKLGIFFGTSTGATENVADLLAAEFGDDAEGPFEIDELQGSIAKKFSEYDALIVGTPTWNTGADSERSGTGWDEVYYGEMQDLQIAGKKVAVFGLGDQISYGENYADASGELHDVFQDLGCSMIGYTSQEGYEHEASKAIRGDKFCGLLCDEVNQDDLTEERVQNWASQLRAEGILAGASSASAPVNVVDVSAVEVDVAMAAPDMDAITKLEQENAELRKMLEENSKMLDKVLEQQGSKTNFSPHFNAKTKVTMWTSGDGKKCYYTTDAPRSP
jgi:flavodoxin I